MSISDALALALDPACIFLSQGLIADPWQRDILLSQRSHVLLNCSRQSGKSTVVAALALHQALITPQSLVLLVAPAQRQSHELFRKVLRWYHALGETLPSRRASASELELTNGSRIIALPGVERTIRSYSGVSLLIIDEAARVPDDLYRSVRPMLAVSRGRLIALSTPFGQQGWFYREWSGDGPWQRLQITWKECPRIDPALIAEDTRSLGQAWVDQEYGCLFTALEGLVYPEFARACVPEQPVPEGRKLGGIDFGWRNPFAAVWGVLDRDDVLWLHGERYGSAIPLSEHAAVLPKDVFWHADPAGRTEIEELRCRGFNLCKGHNDIRSGIAAVSARIRQDALKVLPACVNLIKESRLYRYPSPQEREQFGENPIDRHNHALAALRYLVATIDRRPRVPHVEPPAKKPTFWQRLHDERLWTPLR
ncbi:MAG: hypothetical protein FJ271_23070 [Planctomycetes bacterium]|nr:hypothetical protein [Planctomycetota bacterium]